MLDWLAVWGVTTAVGLVFKPILEELAKDATKDWVKDFFKDCLKNVVRLPQKEPLEIAAGKALKEFLQLVQQELEDAELSEAELKDYTKSLSEFISNKTVQEILGSAFKEDCQGLDTTRLAKIWKQLKLLPLPDSFDWEQVGKRYLKKVRAILRESDELRSILDSQNLEAIQQNTKELAGIVPEFDLTKYQEAIRERYGNLNLQSLDTSGYAYNELKLWRMFIPQNVREVHEVLPQSQELPKEHQRRLRESNQLEAEITLEELEQHKRVDFEQPIRSVLEVNDQQNHKYLVILGDPGSGKSTLLQYIALNWAESPLNNVISLPIPLLIELRTYMRNRDEKHCKNFLEFFHQSPGSICHLNQHQLDERLKAGKAFVMFDGLDEVFDPGKREDVITDIIRFTNDYRNVRVIVTSRVIGYKPQRLRDAEFRHFMLQDLEMEQVKDFVYRWHELTFKDETDKVRKRDRLQRAIDTSSSIQKLAGNPLLLTMMAILNRNQELPRDRPELYNQASRVLLHQWDVERALMKDQRLDPKTIDYKDKQAMLRQVAYHMQANEKGLAGNLISEDDLIKILTDYLKTIEVSDARAIAKLMINQLRTRNFILCFMGADYYAFVHRTFLEYFCAWEFVWKFEKEQKISLEYLKTEVFGKHWQDESWHEVLRLIAGMIEPKFAGEVIDYLIELNGEKENFINLLLAAKCLLEVRNRSVIARIDNKLFEHTKKITKYQETKEHLTEETKEHLTGKDLRQIEEIRSQAISALATTWKGNPETLSLLKTVAQSNDILSGSSAAVRELAKGWKDDPETISILKTIAADQNWVVSHVAVLEVAQGWQNDPNTLTWLKSLAQCAKNNLIRLTAVLEVAQGWQNDPNTLTWLKSLAQCAKNNSIRVTAVEELARGWKDDPQTLPWLKQRAQADENWTVRQAAVQELATGWKDEPWMFEFLCDRAVNDPFERQKDWQINPRQTALEAILEQYPDHPQTLMLLSDRADNDPDEKVREFAKEKLREQGVRK